MASPPFQVKALYDYSSKEEDDLNFPNGQIITVTDVEDEDWYFGEYLDAAKKKHEGLFPKNFVKIFEPETPPRPSRTSKSKRELEPLALVTEAAKGLNLEKLEASSLPAVPEPASAQFEQATRREIEEEVPVQQPPIQTTKPAATPAPPPQPLATKPAPPTVTKPVPPPTAEKPGIGSFRDRINAFNKPAAPPVAPIKPSGLGSSGGSGFIKKPFVAPPPSKNAYVPPPREPPPQKAYKREEDPEIVGQVSRDVEPEEPALQSQFPPSAGEEEDLPKPTSLKERIALLQKQQMEQAARQAEAGQKKEKQKRPTKKLMDPEEHPSGQADDSEGDTLERMNSGDTTYNRLVEGTRDALPRSSTRPRRSREATPVGSPVGAPLRDVMSDPNDADQSGVGDTEEGDEFSTGRDDSDEKPQRKASLPQSKSSQAPMHQADVGDEEDDAEEEDPKEDEEEDVDPEVKRRMEIRERMAKMSGGMGMAGMFGPPGGLPSKSSAKQASTSSERKASGNSTSDQANSSASRAPPVPMMPMPGLHKVRSPEEAESRPEVSKEAAETPRSVIQGRDPEEMPDVEDIKEEPIPPTRRSTERPAAPPVPQDRPVPVPLSQGRAPPPPVPAERPVPPPPSESRAVARPPPSQPLSPSEGSESDDEMSLHTRSSLRLPPGNDSRPTSRGGPPPLPFIAPPQSLPSRPAAPQSRSSEFGRDPEMQLKETSPTSPIIPSAPTTRSNRIPPIPDSSLAMPSAPQTRAPPPAPPPNAPPPRVPTGEARAPPMPAVVSTARDPESDGEVTEYEGDYDTDMASSAPRKDALKSHARVSSLEDDSMTDETSFHHSALPSPGPASSAAPRAFPPPPPPNQPPRVSRQSSDMPRAAPPPPPPPKAPQQEQEKEEYDPYNYYRSGQRPPPGSRYDMESPFTPRLEDPDPMISMSPPQRSVPPPAPQTQSQYAASPNLSGPAGSGSGTRLSMDVQRNSSTIRRSTDGPRPSGEQGFIASDVDLGQASQWWARPDSPPPVFKHRRDLVYETEETSTTRRGGKQAITKTMYVLFMDYSQTVVTAHFETKEPANASLEQHHEPPPQNPRQDQLETAHSRFGSGIAEGAASKEGSVIGDGSPNALVLYLLSYFPEALLPVGVRAYGALVYANLANASVRQSDEIRPGDIVTFRNAKFSGHRGPMHSKYSNEVGKPDHVGVVIDWDGTKKKVRAWEQGRESRKVKSESFKLGDMRSGEVKVWRVMARSWVGWEGQN